MSDYIHIGSRNFLVLKRDWSSYDGKETPVTESCHFCGKEHIHQGGGGHRAAHCASPLPRVFIANDGTKLSSSDGYWIIDINKP